MVNLWIYVYAFATLLVNQSVSAIDKGKNIVPSDSSLAPSIHYRRHKNESECLWMLCSESKYDCFGIVCSQSGPVYPFGYCATYSEDTKLLSTHSCRYLESEGYKTIIFQGMQYTLLPRNLSQLNDYMCGPMNRKGLVC